MKGDRGTALVCKENKFLMIFRCKNNSEYYVLPGGHVEDGETSEEATIRELFEETSIIAEVDKKIITFKDANGRTHQIFLCKYISGTPKMSDNSVEVERASEVNIYKPMWVDKYEIKSFSIWPEETKKYLIDYFNK